MTTDPNETPTSQETEKKPLTPEETLAFEHQRLQEEIELHKSKYLRSLAELENTRKRMQKERQEMTKFAVDTVIADFLDPLDNFEKALSCTGQMSAETRNWAMGFKMILTQLSDVLTQHGVVPFESVGHQFDPHLHEAVSVEETDGVQEGYIIEQFARGYKSADRTLRPARVKVAKKPQSKEETPLRDSEEEKPL
jgi:molecular chaperone GrpE